MRKGRPSDKLQWLLYPEPGAPLPMTPSLRREMRGEGWMLCAERFMPRPGVIVFLNRLHAEKRFVLEPAKDPALDPHQIHSTLLVRGRAHLSTPDDRHFDLTTSRALCYTVAGPNPRFEIPAGVEVMSFGVTLAGRAIGELLGERLPQVLVRLVESQSLTSELVGWTPTARARALAREAFAAPYEGPLRELYLEGVALQLLALQAAALNGGEQSARSAALTKRESVAVRAARERLLSDMRRPPSLGELAVSAGLTGKRLNEGFRALFGATAFEVLRIERLEHARLAIAEADDLPLKELAWRVGYSHVTNFSAAFARHFGESPGKWRKRARQ